MEQFTQPVEGQHDGQETAAASTTPDAGLRWNRSKAARRRVSPRVNTETHANMIRAWKRQPPKKRGQESSTITRDCIKIPTFARRRKNTLCSVQSRPHSPECTKFLPFRGLTIGANHTRQGNQVLVAGCAGAYVPRHAD